jgi:hypothetical protein
MRLSMRIISAVETARVEIFEANRGTTQWWNERRARDEPRYFAGWYWVRKDKRNRVDSEQYGPFKTQSAAIRDAFVKLQLR